MLNLSAECVKFVFVSHIRSFTKKSLLMVVINIVGLNEFKYVGLQRRLTKKFLRGPRPSLRGGLVRH